MLYFLQNMRQCSKKYLTTAGLSTIYNEHMIIIGAECDMKLMAVIMELNPNRVVQWVTPDNAGEHGQ